MKGANIELGEDGPLRGLPGTAFAGAISCRRPPPSPLDRRAGLKKRILDDSRLAPRSYVTGVKALTSGE